MKEYLASLEHGLVEVDVEDLPNGTVRVVFDHGGHSVSTSRQTTQHYIHPDRETVRQWAIRTCTERINELNRQIDEARTKLRWFV